MAQAPAIVRNSALLIIASVLSQLIFMLFTPLLTRIYGPEVFGLSISFYTTSVVIGIILSGRLDLAIVMSPDATEALRIYTSALIFAITLAAAIFIVVLVLNFMHVYVSDFHPILRNKDLLIITSVAYAAQLLSLALGNWNKKYFAMSTAIVLGAIVTVAYSLVSGIAFDAENGLLVGRSLGVITVSVTLIIMLWNSVNHRVLSSSTINVKRTIYNSRRYIQLNVPYSSSEALSMEVFSIVALGFNSARIAGYYVLIRLVMVLPIAIASTAVGQVFFREAVDIFGSKKLESMALVLWKIVSLAVVPFVVTICVFGKTIFGTVFGADWSQAGEMALYYSATAAVIALTGFPARLYEISGRQDLSLGLSLTYLTVKIIAISSMFYFGVYDVFIFATNAIIDFIYYTFYIYVLSIVAGFSIRKIVYSTTVPAIVAGGLSAASCLAILSTFGDTRISAFGALLVAAGIGLTGFGSQIRQLKRLES